MKFILFVNPITAGIKEDGERLRPLGRNTEKYLETISQVRKMCAAAEELGFDCFATTEHHFHSEGFEVSVAPLVLYADLAARTNRIKLAPIAVILPTWDPIRLAEELAVLDNLTEGRLIVGVGRGYQDRWVSVLGQKYRTYGTQSDKSRKDKRNREVFEEMFTIMKAAWTNDLLRYKGKFYEVPFPYDGIKDWPIASLTRRLGVPGEVDEEGTIKGISVVPSPYQKPHPPIFMAFSLSEHTVRWAAENDIVPQINISRPERFKELCQIYQQQSYASRGVELGLGEKVAAARYVYIGKTYEEAYDRAVQWMGWQYASYYNAFGVNEGFRNPEDTDPPPLRFKSPEQATARLVEHQYGLVGTVDDIKRQVESLVRCHDSGNLEWFTWQFDQGIMPFEVAMDQIETFATKIMPEFHG